MSLKGKPLQKCKTTLTFSPPWHSTHWLTVNLGDSGRHSKFRQKKKKRKKKKRCLHIFKIPRPAHPPPTQKQLKNAHAALQAPLGQPLLPCWLATLGASAHSCMLAAAAATASIKLTSTRVSKHPVLALQRQGILFILSLCQPGSPRSLKATPT